MNHYSSEADLPSFRKSDNSTFTFSKVTSVRLSRFSRSSTKLKIYQYISYAKIQSVKIPAQNIFLKNRIYLPFSLMSRRLSIAIALVSIFSCNSLTLPIMSVILSSTEKV